VRRKRINSQHEIELGEYDGTAVAVRLDTQGKLLVRIGPQVDITPDHLLRLTLDAVGAGALLRKHAGC
jgi:hypothetical protein